MKIKMEAITNISNENAADLWIEQEGLALEIHLREKNKDARITLFENEVKQLVMILNKYLNKEGIS